VFDMKWRGGVPGCRGEYLEVVAKWEKQCNCLMSDIPVNGD
jgi:hypothetical protein